MLQFLGMFSHLLPFAVPAEQSLCVSDLLDLVDA